MDEKKNYKGIKNEGNSERLGEKRVSRPSGHAED